jgi:hypothetical protein
VAPLLTSPIDLTELMARDTLQQEELCGGHFRQNSPPSDEAQRDDDTFAVIAVVFAWKHRGEGE